MAELLKPQFFVVRENNTIVPLIAMDELPPTVKIRSVPRTLELGDTQGMVNVGKFDARHEKHIVEGIHNTLPLPTPVINGYQPPTISVVNKNLMDSKFAPLNYTTNADTSSQQLVSTSPRAYGIDEQPPSLIDTSIPVPTASPQRDDRRPSLTAHVPLPPWHDTNPELRDRKIPGVKEYCSYWLRHGECDYAQQGCLYKHEMPVDKPTLLRLGLRDVPRWYRERHGIPSFLAQGTTTSGLTADEDEERRINSLQAKQNAMEGGSWRKTYGKDSKHANKSSLPFQTASRKGLSAHRVSSPYGLGNSRTAAPARSPMEAQVNAAAMAQLVANEKKEAARAAKVYRLASDTSSYATRATTGFGYHSSDDTAMSSIDTDSEPTTAEAGKEAGSKDECGKAGMKKVQRCPKLGAKSKGKA